MKPSLRIKQQAGLPNVARWTHGYILSFDRMGNAEIRRRHDDYSVFFQGEEADALIRDLGGTDIDTPMIAKAETDDAFFNWLCSQYDHVMKETA